MSKQLFYISCTPNLQGRRMVLSLTESTYQWSVWTRVKVLLLLGLVGLRFQQVFTFQVSCRRSGLGSLNTLKGRLP